VEANSSGVAFSSGAGRWLLAVTIAGSGMAFLDSTVVNVALPKIGEDLNASTSALQWILNGYLLTLASLILLGGSLGDRLGRRRVFQVGVTLFTLASLLCAVAPNVELLIFARLVQGIGGALLTPGSLAIIEASFRPADRARAIGAWSGLGGVAGAIGPLVGGWLIGAISWRAIFLINLPIAAAAIIVAARRLPRVVPATPDARPDLLSVALSMAGGFGLVYPLIEGRQNGWPLWCVALLIAGALAFAAFVVRQRAQVARGRSPLVDPSLFGRRPYVAGLAVVLTFIAAMGGMLLALNVMLQYGLGDSPLACGLAVAAVPVLATGGSITSSILLERLGRTTMHIGVVVMAVGLALTVLVLHHVGAGLDTTDPIAPLAVTGFGMGMVFVPMFDVILAGVAPRQLGSASGLLESVQQLAMSLGIAAVGTVLFDVVGHGGGAAVYVHAASRGLLVAIAFLIAAGVAICWLPRHARSGH
jgi:EmrB/QacA subfamily drug resistance transporter